MLGQFIAHSNYYYLMSFCWLRCVLDEYGKKLVREQEEDVKIGITVW